MIVYTSLKCRPQCLSLLYVQCQKMLLKMLLKKCQSVFLVISSTGQHLASCSEDKTIRLIKFQPGTGAFVNVSEMRKLNGHRGSVNDVKFAPNANFLASASQDKTIRICETATGTCAIVLDDPFGAVQRLCYSLTGSYMISLSSP